MKPSDKLNLDEILVLKWRGLSTAQIQQTDITAFDRMYLEDPDEFDKLIDKANDIFNRQEKIGIKTITIQDDRYPAKLRSIGKDAPVLIYCVGNIDLLNQFETVTITGARIADHSGLKVAYELGQQYSEQGNVIVSGLELGCQFSAHKGCLDAKGKTMAIVGCGLDKISPRASFNLHMGIIEHGGLIVSEQCIGKKADAGSMYNRCRILAGVSERTILAQSPSHSSYLHTMWCAQKYNRECYAVEFRKATETNSGNRELITKNYAQPLKI